MVNEMRLSGSLSLKPEVIAANLSSQLGTTVVMSNRGSLRGEDLHIANTVDYNTLTSKPAINGNTLIGDQTGSDLGLQNLLIPGNGIDITDNHIFSSTSQPLYGTIEEQPKANRAIGKTLPPRDERKSRRNEPKHA